MTWLPVCPAAQVPAERAVCVLVGGEQVALVRTADGQVHALDNGDPVTGAMVMSRGLVGSRGTDPVLISPLNKHAYSLLSGRSLDLPETALRVHGVRVVDGMVHVDLTEAVRRPA